MKVDKNLKTGDEKLEYLLSYVKMEKTKFKKEIKKYPCKDYPGLSAYCRGNRDALGFVENMINTLRK